MRKINEIILHCSDSPFGDVPLIDSWHKEKGWNGIGYHYVVLNGRLKGSRHYDETVDGAVQRGRPVKKIGSHVYGHNRHSIGICLIGEEDFTVAQLTSLLKLVEDLQEEYGLEKLAVKGHYEYDKQKTCPNFNMDLMRKVINNESFSEEFNSFH